MEEGFVLDLNQHSSGAPAKWIEGKPEKSFWTGVNIKNREQVPITSYRCKTCGLLLNYAV